MSAAPSALSSLIPTGPAPIRNSSSTEQKLFETALSSCISGIQKFTVSKPKPRTVTAASTPWTFTVAQSVDTPPKAEGTPWKRDFTEDSGTGKLAEPFISPHSKDLARHPQPGIRNGTPVVRQPLTVPRSQPPSVSAMNRKFAPLRGSGLASSQFSAANDIKSTIPAAEPPAASSSIKLKKGAVKIVGPAGPSAPAPQRALPAQAPLGAAPAKGPSAAVGASTPLSSPPKLSVAEEKDLRDFLRTKAIKAGQPSTPKMDVKDGKDDFEAGLDAMFARLKAGTPSTTSTPKSEAKKHLFNPSADKFAFESPTKTSKTDLPQVKEPTGENSDKKTVSGPASDKFSFLLPPKLTKKASAMDKQEVNGDKSTQKGQVSTDKSIAGNHNQDAKGSDETPKQENVNPKQGAGAARRSAEEKNLEVEYLQKAWDYLRALSSTDDTPAHLISTVATKLHQVMKPDTQDVSGLQSAICDAISTHLDGLEGEKDKRNGSLPAKVQQLQKDADGDFLKLCSTLVDMQLLSMDNLDGVVRLCKAIEKVLPQEEKKKMAKFHDPMDNVKAWPTQVKRDSIAGSRTAFLEGVGHLASINQLQALVWGGPLEHIFLPESGKDFAMVTFLKAADCKRYFDATENGIQLPDKTKKLVFVDQRGPNSTNDVVLNAIEGNVTRCVRAVGADDDWKDLALRKLAEGTAQKKRVLDTIKRGKTTRGHYYIEFRFSNIHDSLNFKRELMEDEEWEACNISYAEDPCAIARGVHIEE